MMRHIKVLDHGYVETVAWMGTDETVVEAARMSTGKGFTDWDTVYECTKCGYRSPFADLGNGFCLEDGRHEPKRIQGDARLLEFLYKNFHMSPFEQCELAVEVQAPLMVFREWQRHRTGQYNEFSGRYAQMPNLHYLPELERFQKQSTANKQGSAEAIDPHVATMQRELLRLEQSSIYEHYEHLLSGENALAKEVARLNTPLSRYSKMRAKMNLRNWFQFLNLRMRPNAQLEIRLYAEAVASIIKEIWPRSYALFEEYDLKGVRLSATEASVVREMIRELNVAPPPEVVALRTKLGAP